MIKKFKKNIKNDEIKKNRTIKRNKSESRCSPLKATTLKTFNEDRMAL